MIMFEQQRRLSQPLRWGRRERVIVGALVGVLLAGALALAAFALTSGAPARRDCVEFTFASTLGGARVHGCGGRAREICASPGAFRGSEEVLSEACRKAGFAVGG